jgi:predicted DNA-binding transcriptional regulator AlpA
LTHLRLSSKLLDMANIRVVKPGQPFVTTNQYAARAGLSQGLVQAMIKRGDIPARTDLGKWARIPVEEYNKLPPLQVAQS